MPYRATCDVVMRWCDMLMCMWSTHTHTHTHTHSYRLRLSIGSGTRHFDGERKQRSVHSPLLLFQLKSKFELRSEWLMLLSLVECQWLMMLRSLLSFHDRRCWHRSIHSSARWTASLASESSFAEHTRRLWITHTHTHTVSRWSTCQVKVIR